MLWLEHLRQSTEAYRDFLAFLAAQKGHAAMQFLTAKDMEAINKIKGRVEGLTVLELFVTEKEREDADAANRTAERERERTGTPIAH